MVVKSLLGGDIVIIAICIDDKSGLSFFGKRLSRDKEQINDLMNLCDGKIRIASYSQILFEGYDVFVDDNLLDNACDGEYCFIENKSIGSYEDQIEKLIVYKWNRHYPSDKKFVIPEGFSLVESFDFQGNSHENITREIYIKKEVDVYVEEDDNRLEYCFYDDTP